MDNRLLCAYCGNPHGQCTGHVNRAIKKGLSIYCNRECAGMGRRSGKSEEQKKAEKVAYDIEYRQRKANELKAKKQAYHQRTYDPDQARIKRKERMPWHIEY